MSKKVQREFRSSPLSAKEVASDAQVRSYVASEFPPLVRSQGDQTLDTLSEALRTAIKERGNSLDALAAECDLPVELLNRFVRGERDIRMSTADRLAVALGVKAVTTPH